MPPKKTTENGNDAAGHSLTESEASLVTAIIELMSRSSLDYEALALKLGSASTNAARQRVNDAVKKHATWFTGPAAATNEDGTPVKKPRAKRTPKKKAPSDGDEDADEQATPSKKKARVSKDKAKVEVKDEEDVSEEAVKQEVGDPIKGQI